jgi:hypothetical protein
MATLQNLEQETILKLENRTSETSSIDRWLRDSLIEIAGNPDYRDSFPELEVTGPFFNLTGGVIGVSVQEYPETSFLTAPDGLIKSLDFRIWIDYPKNSRFTKLNPSNFQDADKFLSDPSLPTEWYRYGNNIGFKPMPDKNYQVQARIMRRHPITDYFNALGTLNTTTLLLPTEWFEVLEWAAAMRGFMELLQFEKASEIRTMLWGDPDEKKKNPGLIASVKTKRRSEAWLQQQALRPMVKTYSFGTRGGR